MRNWEEVYRTTAAYELGWDQAHPTMSLHLIKSTGIPKTGTLIDEGGDDSTVVDHLFNQGFEHITVLDLSAAALERANRTGRSRTPCGHREAV